MKVMQYSNAILFLSLMLLLSCSKEVESIRAQEINATEEQKLVPMMILGRQLDNPYSTANMRKAFDSLSQQTKSSVSDNAIQTTHLYVKFIPKSEDELSILKTDSTLVLFQYPLDYEILSYGSYRDPDIPEDQPTPLYASVPVGKNLPSSVETVILEELYIPEEIISLATKSIVSLPEEFVDALIAKSFELTGNEYEMSPATTKGGNSKWVPQGYVKYYDSVLGKTLPIEGLQVRCNRWFTTYTAYTDSTGMFKCKSSETFKNPANYSIVYERYDYEIRDAWLSTAKYDGPKTSGAWNVDFTGDLLNTYYSTVFRAAYKYYYQDIHGLSRPPMNSFWKTKTRIKASKKDKDFNGNILEARRFLGLGSAIHIYMYNEPLSQTFATTIHELAHAAHWGLYKSDYNKASDFVLESWTRGVQLFLTKDIYPNYGTSYAGKTYNSDNYISYATLSYTGLIRDLADDAGLKKNAYYYYEKDEYHVYDKVKSYTDNVSGYTMPQIEQSLSGARDASSWENNLKNKFDNETENYLHDAFDFWGVK